MYIYYIENRFNYGFYVIASNVNNAIELFINNLGDDDNKEIDHIKFISAIKPSCIESK